MPIPKTPRKRSSSYSRTKGHNAEREWVIRFREEFGFEYAKTSRNASKLLDDSKVDIAFVPLNLQIKKGYAKARPKADQVFKEMKELLEKHFPPGDPQRDLMKALIHDIDCMKPEHMLVTMMWRDWKEVYKGYLLWQKAQAELLIKETI